MRPFEHTRPVLTHVHGIDKVAQLPDLRTVLGTPFHDGQDLLIALLAAREPSLQPLDSQVVQLQPLTAGRQETGVGVSLLFGASAMLHAALAGRWWRHMVGEMVRGDGEGKMVGGLLGVYGGGTWCGEMVREDGGSLRSKLQM